MGNSSQKQNNKLEKQSLITEYSNAEILKDRRVQFQFKNVTIKKQHSKLIEKIDFTKIGSDIDAGKLQSGKWRAMEVYRLCPYIDEWKIKQEFSAYNGQEPQIIAHIQMIKFPNLKTMNLWGNSIESIQQLSHLYMPLLQSLWLWENNITCIKSLRKANLPNLTTLDLKKNPIIQFKSLSQLFVSKKILQRFDVESRNQQNKENTDISWIVKLQAVYISQISLNKKDDRLNQDKIFNKLKPKMGKLLY